MKLKKSIKLPTGTVIPAGTELHFGNEGLGYFEGEQVKLASIPEVALESDKTPPSKIFAYSDNMRTVVKAKTKAEPWLHIVFDFKLGKYAIFVWDTREVLESGKLPSDSVNINGKPVNDNHEPLKGGDGAKFSLIQELYVAAAIGRYGTAHAVRVGTDNSELFSQVSDYAKRNGSDKAKSWFVAPYVDQSVKPNDYILLMAYTKLGEIRKMLNKYGDAVEFFKKHKDAGLMDLKQHKRDVARAKQNGYY